MEKLRKQLSEFLSRLKNGNELSEQLNDLVLLYPFNEYEYIISHLLGLDSITIEDYYELRDDYIARNMFLYVFEISAPTGFGKTWAEGQVKSLCPELTKPNRKNNPNYRHFDFCLGKIKVEVKASRAVNSDSNEPLYVKALSSDSTKPFDMNFQQIKPDYCDVFVWVAVWRDLIRYWVLSADEVKSNKHYSDKQHKGNKGEGQLHVNHRNITDFTRYEVASNKLQNAIKEAYKRQKN